MSYLVLPVKTKVPTLETRMWPSYVLVVGTMILTSTVVFGCASSKMATTSLLKEPGTTQHIEQVMQAATTQDLSTADYTKGLNAGDEVNGNIMVVGWDVEFLDWASPWNFEVWAPDGTLVDSASIIWDVDQYYAFKFVAKIAGEYSIRAIHRGLAARDLDIMISPAGWHLKADQTK
jgi:hypothetical protein